MTIHVIGAGLAGLAAAVEITRRKEHATLWDAVPHVGGRCRSLRDPKLGRVIDNGNHLALSGNRALTRYLDLIGAADRMETLRPAAIPFIDIGTGARWTIRPGIASLLGATLTGDGLPPGVSARVLALDLLRLGLAKTDATVLEVLGPAGRPAFRCFWEPVSLSILNTHPARASAAMLWAVARETLIRGEAACRPMLPRESLDDALIAPAVGWLRERGAAFRLATRVTGLVLMDDRVMGLETAATTVSVAPGDRVILAVPPNAAKALLPGLPTPEEGGTILNIHYGISGLAATAPRLMGVVGGRIEWMFRHTGRLSVTTSAADELADRPGEELGPTLWSDVAAALRAPELAGLTPPFRVIKARRATFDATSAAANRPSGPDGGLSNLFLAGDWCANPLPGTMEAAVRAGFAAAVRAAGEPPTAGAR